MNTDIRLTVDCSDHPKIEKLCRRLGDGAFRSWIRLLGFTAINHTDGILAGMDEEDIEIAAGWKGEPGRFITELEAVRLIEKFQCYEIHDWQIHQPYATGAIDRKIRGIKGNLASQVSRGFLTQKEADLKLNRRIELLKSTTSGTTSKEISTISVAPSKENRASSGTPLRSSSAPAPAIRSGSAPLANMSASADEGEVKEKKPRKPKADKPIPPPAKSRIISDAYQNEYLKRFGKKPPWGPVEGKRIQQLLAAFGDDAERIAGAIHKAFNCDDEFLQGTVGSFMTLTAAAVIAKADTIDAGEPEPHRMTEAEKVAQAEEEEKFLANWRADWKAKGWEEEPLGGKLQNP